MSNRISLQDAKNVFMQRGATGAVALADGTVFFGRGTGAENIAIGELCFNTAITGYQEILTDPSYSEQIVLFTFPHIGNVGTNSEDDEASSLPAQSAARGAIFRNAPTEPSNWRASGSLDHWLKTKNIVGLSGIDTRAVTKRIRELGMPKAAICHSPDGQIDVDALVTRAREWAGLEGADLASDVTTPARFNHTEGLWRLGGGFQQSNGTMNIVLMDFGVKKNILRNLSEAGFNVKVVPANTSADDILSLTPDGVVLSNGPGDPAATADYAADEVKKLIEADLPILGICLGHQLLALALGAKTMKMPQGHHGANHPVKDLATGKVEIVSMNHGFTVDPNSLPAGVSQSHVSLFDGTNCGLTVNGRAIISVQHHPEASPGPQDSFYMFRRFADLVQTYKAKSDI